MKMTIASIAVALVASTSTCIGTPMSPAPLGQAADQLSQTEIVHCRPWPHWHRWGFGRGCGSRVYFDERVRVHRYGYGYRDRYHREGGRFGVREDFRGSSRSGIREDFRGGSRGGATVGGQVRREGARSGASFEGGATTRQGGGVPAQTGAGGPRGGTINSAPSGTDGGSGGTGGGPGQGGGQGGRQQ